MICLYFQLELSHLPICIFSCLHGRIHCFWLLHKNYPCNSQGWLYLLIKLILYLLMLFPGLGAGLPGKVLFDTPAQRYKRLKQVCTIFVQFFFRVPVLCSIEFFLYLFVKDVILQLLYIRYEPVAF